ncbi:thiamine pyrophosphokinase [Evansella caseinilytica]|uniref:Thiamine diphosphokinase n=1 Tax=Evansella caseinilytica TaxID=1503961 RepID=A0A1H3MBR3_9BACI|nr:thiamine diphosphokinase [Evansella caseinilytica]SDY74023.1 thiamine pyrophosphokinase [Evansella caseinilytica]
MKYVLLAGGPITNVPPLDVLKYKWQDAGWIGVDRGVYHLLKHGIIPLRAFGDFDSLTLEEKEWVHAQYVHLSQFPAEKDATDMELALDWALAQKPRQIVLLGGSGGRLDHFLINIQLLQKGLDYGVEISLEDRWNRITIREPGEYTIEKSEFRYVSFIPFTREVEGIALKGFRYPLTNRRLAQASSLCISNELVKTQGSYSFAAGKLLVVESLDQHDQRGTKKRQF